MLDLHEDGRRGRLGFILNGEDVVVEIETRDTLIDVIRNKVGLLGTKLGCDAQVCGACTVLVDGNPASACTVFAFAVAGRSVETIEGLSPDGTLSPIQEAFARNSAFQCGYCTSGQIMACVGLLRHDAHPTRDQAEHWLAGNICRCTAYDGILQSVMDAGQATGDRRG